MVVAGKLSAEVGVVGVVEKLSVEVVAGGVVVAGVEKVDVVAGVEKVDVVVGVEVGALKADGAGAEVGALKADGAGAEVGILKVVGAGAGVVNILREAAGVVGCAGAVICAGAGGV